MENSNWFNKKVQDVEKELNTNVKKGLTEEEVLARREKYGLNALKAKKKKTLIQKFLEQFKDFSVIILIIAAVVSGIVGMSNGEGLTDTIVILLVLTYFTRLETKTRQKKFALLSEESKLEEQLDEVFQLPLNHQLQ